MFYIGIQFLSIPYLHETSYELDFKEMASAALSGSSILDDDIAADDGLVSETVASHGSLLDDEREADLGLEVQSEGGMMAEISGGDDAVSLGSFLGSPFLNNPESILV